MFVQQAVPISLGKSVAVTSKPSEAANLAIDAALPLLVSAEQATVLVETEDGDHEPVPANQMHTLEQAGVPLSVVRFEANRQNRYYDG